MAKPILSRYSLVDAAEYLTENADDEYGPEFVESLIEERYCIACVYSTSRGRWVYLDANGYQEPKGGGGTIGFSLSLRDARMGFYCFMPFSKTAFRSEVKVPREELDKYLADPDHSQSRNSLADRVRRGIKEKEGIMGKKRKKVERVPWIISFILNDLQGDVLDFDSMRLQGSVADFHWFCGQFSVIIGNIDKADTFKDYCKKKRANDPILCAWPRGAAADRDYWKEILIDWGGRI